MDGTDQSRRDSRDHFEHGGHFLSSPPPKVLGGRLKPIRHPGGEEYSPSSGPLVDSIRLRASRVKALLGPNSRFCAPGKESIMRGPDKPRRVWRVQSPLSTLYLTRQCQTTSFTRHWWTSSSGATAKTPLPPGFNPIRTAWSGYWALNLTPFSRPARDRHIVFPHDRSNIDGRD